MLGARTDALRAWLLTAMMEGSSEVLQSHPGTSPATLFSVSGTGRRIPLAPLHMGALLRVSWAVERLSREDVLVRAAPSALQS